jgi:hypothetical protein
MHNMALTLHACTPMECGSCVTLPPAFGGFRQLLAFDVTGFVDGVGYFRRTLIGDRRWRCFVLFVNNTLLMFWFLTKYIVRLRKL